VPDDPEGRAWTGERLAEALDAYHAEHGRIRLDPKARTPHHTHASASFDGTLIEVTQVLVDPDDFCDWVAEFEVDLEASRAKGEPVVRLRRIGAMA
jgi:hypothetical protein